MDTQIEASIDSISSYLKGIRSLADSIMYTAPEDYNKFIIMARRILNYCNQVDSDIIELRRVNEK